MNWRTYSAAEVRALERHAIEFLHIPAFVLMQRAGTAAFAALRQHWPAARHVLALCGCGNNGGDGLVIAGLAREAGLGAEAWLLGKRTAVTDTAAEALAFAEARKVPVIEKAKVDELPQLPPGTVLVDALLGIGLSGDLRPATQAAIDAINRSGLPVLAVDVPSGLCSDTGAIRGACVKAAVTVTFIGIKHGLCCGAGPAHAGTVEFDALGVRTG